jgi:magnesium chelatase subunit D
MTATFPFTGVVGNDLAKNGLLAALVSPHLSGVLIRGGTGTGKTTLVRSMAGLVPGLEVVNMPLNVTEDQMLGGMDLEAALTEGRVRRTSGLLDRARGHVLYADETNLLPERYVHLMADASAFPERTDEASFILVGAMDPDEGELSPHLMDRFDIVVDIAGAKDAEERLEVLRRGMDLIIDPVGLMDRFSGEEEELRRTISQARDILPYVTLPVGHTETIAHVVLELGTEGSRGEIAVARTAMALAALAGREEANLDDVKTAAVLCLGHRRRPVRKEGERAMPEGEDGPQPCEDGDAGRPSNEVLDTIEAVLPSPDRVIPIGEGKDLGNLFAKVRRPALDRRHRSGRRDRVICTSGHGRYVTSRLPRGRSTDLAFDATFRAAAPHQLHRERRGMALAIEPSDLREKVRMDRTGSTILFLVDASGSMGVRERMAMVKGTVLAMLTDSYQKRDSVGLVVFHRESAEVMLPLTRSVQGAYRKLKEIPTGGRTPLALGLIKAGEVISVQMSRCWNVNPSLVIISDGRANVPLAGGDPFSEALDVAREISQTSIRTVVVDTGTGMPRIDRGERLAMALGGSYLRLEDMSSSQLARTIRAASLG